MVELPDRGKLIVATDFQGHVDDFDRLAAVFERAAAQPGGAYLVVTGDLVHGPEIDEEDWPEYLGSYYRGDSKTLVERAFLLQRRHAGRVHYLLGNHEHAHLGGPVVSKFFPDEAERLESLLGPDGAEWLRAWLRTWPLVAFAPRARIALSHAAPHATIADARELEELSLEGAILDATYGDPTSQSTLGALLWARTTTTERANAFLRALHPDLRVALFGHDVAREGFAIDREPLLCVSTSFGCYDGDKLYFEWDLARPAESAEDAARHGLRPLYPEIEPVYRTFPPHAFA